jgi:hypothetical protein
MTRPLRIRVAVEVLTFSLNGSGKVRHAVDNTINSRIELGDQAGHFVGRVVVSN